MPSDSSAATGSVVDPSAWERPDPVPVAASEVHALRHLIDAMPAPRRTAVRERFADAVRRLDAAGALAGALLFRRIPQKLFNDLVLFIAGMAALRMLLQS